MIKLATLFSGIGAIEQALIRMGVPYEVVFACDNGEIEIEFDLEQVKKEISLLDCKKAKKDYVDNLYKSLSRKKNHVKESYLANYSINQDDFHLDIRLLDGTDYAGKVDLLVGGSPCQSFSSVGFQGGLEDARGTLFYDYARVIQEVRPKVFIYENVRNLLKHDKGKTWDVIKSIFDSLGYTYKFAVLNSSDYGIPQTRRRLFVVGFKDDVEFEMPPLEKELGYVMKDFCIDNCIEGGMTYDENGDIMLSDVPGVVDNKYILSPLLYDYVMKTGTKTWSQKVEINLDIARTLLKTMGNRHRAGVDNYVSFDGTENQGSVRMLTEREAHRLMGFTDDYKIVVSRAQAYKQAGNSIVVDVLMEILKSIIDTNVFGG